MIENQEPVQTDIPAALAETATQASPETKISAPVEAAEEIKPVVAGETLSPLQKALAAAKKEEDARAVELKACEGKFYRPKTGQPTSTYFKVLRYNGIGTLQGGIRSHIFTIERFNPGAIWTPPATKFLAENEEFTPADKTIQPCE